MTSPDDYTKRANGPTRSTTADIPHDDDDGAEATAPPQPPAAPQPPPPTFRSLPDIAHAAIASFLTTTDQLRVMESSRWLLDSYGKAVKELTIHCQCNRIRDLSTTNHSPTMFSLLSHRPSLTQLNLEEFYVGGGVGEALASGLGPKIHSIEVRDFSFFNPCMSSSLSPFFQGLGSPGACPKLHTLLLKPNANVTESVAAMGEGLRLRTQHGHPGLKSLSLYSDSVHDLSPLLSSGACDLLEELKLGCDSLGNLAMQALTEWMTTTKALHLVRLMMKMNGVVAAALAQEGVAPRLQALELQYYSIDALGLGVLAEAIKRGSFPDLRELQLLPGDQLAGAMMVSLAEALCVGARELRLLCIKDRFVRPEGVVALARSLTRDGGACPKLEELRLDFVAHVGNQGGKELFKAFRPYNDDWASIYEEDERGGNAPCSATLRRLTLTGCNLDAECMETLLGVGYDEGLPQLEYLDLSCNPIGDYGLAFLTEGMVEGRPFLELQELNLTSTLLTDRGGDDLKTTLTYHENYYEGDDYRPLPKLKKLHVKGNRMKSSLVRELRQELDEDRGQGKVEVIANRERSTRTHYHHDDDEEEEDGSGGEEDEESDDYESDEDDDLWQILSQPMYY